MRRRARHVFGEAIGEDLERLRQREKERLFAGVIAGWETHIGQDFDTGRHLGYRALINRGFSQGSPPADIDAELEKVVQQFICLWTQGLADAGIPSHKIYAHTAFASRRVYAAGQPRPLSYLQLATAPGQSGMNLETYLARMFQHGATLVNIFSWGVGGEANKNIDFHVVTEGQVALGGFRGGTGQGQAIQAPELPFPCPLRREGGGRQLPLSLLLRKQLMGLGVGGSGGLGSAVGAPLVGGGVARNCAVCQAIVDVGVVIRELVDEGIS